MRVEPGIVLKTGFATLLYQFGRFLEWFGKRLSGQKEQPAPDPKSPEGIIASVNHVLDLFQAQICIEYQIHSDNERRAKRNPPDWESWCVGRRIPQPFQGGEVTRGDIMALTAGGFYNRSLLIEAAKNDPVAIANYLLLDRAGLLRKTELASDKR